ncbi:MAG: hypothetical protein C4574_06880 [Candidatus Latescibacterota bacterium]|nr:MAG: hypothetical protein C4574_06880 [Candidatus Latescibacterota bacterium]
MTILDFERIVRTEQAAANHLLERCSAAAPPRCPVCSREKLYVIESGKRRRCARCGHRLIVERNEVKAASAARCDYCNP